MKTLYSTEWISIIFFTKESKTMYLQGFWPKSLYLKCFGNQLKTVYLQRPHSSRPCCTLILVHACNAMRKIKKSRFLRFYVLFICVFFLVLVWFFKWQNWRTLAIVRLQQSDLIGWGDLGGVAHTKMGGAQGGGRVKGAFFNEMFVFF